MGPMRQNPIQRTVRTAHLSVLMTVHDFQYTVQHRTVLIISLLTSRQSGRGEEEKKRKLPTVSSFQKSAPMVLSGRISVKFNTYSPCEWALLKRFSRSSEVSE